MKKRFLIFIIIFSNFLYSAFDFPEIDQNRPNPFNKFETLKEKKIHLATSWKTWRECSAQPSDPSFEDYVVNRGIFEDAVTAGIDPNYSVDNQTIMNIAIRYDHIPLIRLCLEKEGKPDIKQARTVKTAKFLLEKGIKLSNSQGSRLFTDNILHIVVDSQYEPGLVDLYRREYKVDVNARDKNYNTPMHLLARYCINYRNLKELHDKAHYLLNYWPELVQVRLDQLNNEGKTAFQLACKHFEEYEEINIDKQDQSIMNLIRIMNLVAMSRLPENAAIIDPRKNCCMCKEADEQAMLRSPASSPRSDTSPRSPRLRAFANRLKASPTRELGSPPSPDRRRRSSITLPAVRSASLNSSK